MDRAVIVTLALIVTAIVWVVALAMGRVRRSDAIAGLTVGLLIAVVLGVAVSLAAYLILSSQPNPVWSALSAGFVIGGGFLWLGATLLPIGFIARGGRDWARVGAWVAVVVIVVSVGIGWTTWMAYYDDPSAPQPSPTALP